MFHYTKNDDRSDNRPGDINRIQQTWAEYGGHQTADGCFRIKTQTTAQRKMRAPNSFQDNEGGLTMLGVKNRYVKDEDGKRTFLAVKVTSKKKT